MYPRRATRLEDGRRVRAQGGPDVTDALDKRVLGNEHVWPNGLHQLVLRNHPLAVAKQIDKDIEGLRPQWQRPIRTREAGPAEVHTERAESQDGFGWHVHDKPENPTFQQYFTVLSRLPTAKTVTAIPSAALSPLVQRESAMRSKLRTVLPVLAVLLAPAAAQADVITDWNAKAEAIGIEKALGPPPNARGMAMMHVAMFEAVNAVTHRYVPYRLKLTSEPGASPEAAAAMAAHDVLVKLYPDQQASLDSTLKASLGQVPDGDAKTKGIDLGRQAAAGVLALRGNDGIAAPETYRPVTTAGAYIPTPIPVSSTIGKLTPWVMTAGDQFRPVPPPALTSPTWTADVNEIREVGGRNSTKRTADQTDAARFWAATGPHCWQPIVRQLAAARNLGLTDSARLFALVGIATSDSFIAVFDAKFHYNLWRPVTAIRNADITGNANTPREASWLPLIDTPMHPEYPCAHCISSGAAANVMQLVLGDELPEFSMISPALPGVNRRWTKLQDYSDEVSNARVWGGIHYRNSTVVGQDMGRKIADLTVKSLLLPINAPVASGR